LSPGAKMGCFTFIKVMMILFNLAIFLGGGTLLGVGIWVKVDGESFLDIFGPLSSSILQVVNVAYLLIVLGAILLVIGFLGCCGAQKESKCLLMMFFSLVLIIFIAEVAAAVVALVFTGLAETLLTGLVTPLLKEKYGEDDTFTQIWNVTMTEVHCCGLNNYTDFNNSYYYGKHDSYPRQCCGMEPGHYLPFWGMLCPGSWGIAISCHPHPRGCLLQGCFKQILTEIRTNAGVAGGVAAGIAALEIASMAVSMYLYCRLDEK
ncbi:TSN1 protein, partial [Phainopepla nitens]|nr:TSN1 protein [Phainopepla nitens]